MRRSIRSSLFLLVAPFALTFTLVAWVVSSKIGPWLSQPLVPGCSDKGYSDWFCSLQSGLLPWILLGVGILILLSVTALLSLGLFKAHIKELQQDVLDFQKGHRNTLSPDAPGEMGPLVQLLNRILQAGADNAPVEPAGYASAHAATERGQSRPSLQEESLHTDRRVSPPKAPPPRRTETPPAPTARPKPAMPEEPRRQPEPSPGPAPAPQPTRDNTEDLDMEVSLEELDADIEKALKEAPPQPDPTPAQKPEPTPERRPREPSPPEPTRPSAAKAEYRPDDEAESVRNSGPEPATTGRSSRNLAFPTRKCRKLIALLGHRYPDVNFELITDVAESDPWTIREAELTEIFGHLLDNAGKWAESQVNIFLAIKGNMLVFGVADDGPGLDSEITQHLGEDGFRVNADEPAGEGLVTVRRTLDAHGGSLAFDRSRLGGLEVIAAIPGSPLPRHVSARGAYH